MTTSPPAARQDLRGAQTPRLSCVPDYCATTGEEATELAALAGLYLDPWQQWVLRHSLGERPDGKWAAFEVGLVVGRQNGKNAILEARELAELYLVAPAVGPRLIIHSAHQFKTSLEHFRRLTARIKATPELLAKVKHRGRLPVGIRDSHGEESIELIDGSRILFAARTSSGGQGAGFTADLLVWDEAWNLPDSVVGMVLPTVSAKTLLTPGVQVFYTSQAVNQQTMPYGLQLARIRERGIRGEAALFFAEWSVDPDAFKRHPEMAHDPLAWAQANPGLGVRIAAEHVAREAAGAMPWVEFLAHRLGIGDWPDTSEDAGRVISAEAWGDIAEHDQAKRITSAPLFAIDVNPSQTWGSIAVAGRREDRLIQFALIEHARGTDWLIEKCKFLRQRHPRCRFAVHKSGPAAEKIAELKDAKLRVIELDSSDYALACSGFVTLVSERRGRYPHPQPELDDALAAARSQNVGDGWKWSRRNSTSPDISPIVAASIAAWAVEHGKARSRVINPYQYV